MERKVVHTIDDILETIEQIVGKTFAEFESDWELRFIVQRAIEIVSEATRRLPEELKARQMTRNRPRALHDLQSLTSVLGGAGVACSSIWFVNLGQRV